MKPGWVLRWQDVDGTPYERGFDSYERARAHASWRSDTEKQPDVAKVWLYEYSVQEGQIIGRLVKRYK